MKKIILLLIVTMSISAQSKDPQKILDKVVQNFNSVQDYTVNAKINVDIEFLKVPEMNAKVYFKQPDKMKMDSKGFAMLPRQAFNFSPNSLLEKKHTSVYTGTEKLNGKNVDVIRVIPTSDSSEVILSTLWIEQDKYLIRKIESTSRQGGTFQINLSYDGKSAYPLPSSIKFEFDLPKLNLPKKLSGKMDNKEEKKSDHPGKGIVMIKYSDYKVNQGIPDAVFAEKKK